MRARLLCFFVAMAVLSLSGSAMAQPVETPPAEPTPDAPAPDPREEGYQSHMKNGIKLFNEKKWDGAVAEFWAAYREKPVGSPLINLALAYKQMKNSAKAIEVLELALAKHADSLPPDQIEAAKTEIREMKNLLAWVTVKIQPDAKGVVLYIDGRRQDDGTWTKPIPLEPGTRTFMAKRAGYDNATAEVQVVAGLKNDPVLLELVQKDGRVRIQANEPDAEIRIDGQSEGKGSYDDLLPRGIHRVAVVVGDDENEIQILVRPGGDHTVTQKDDGSLVSEAEVDEDEPDPFGPPAILEPLRGIYGYGGGTLLTAFTAAGGDDFVPTNAIDRWGAAASLHLGYRVAEWAGFEFWGQYSDVRVLGRLTLPPSDTGAARVYEQSQMILKSGRFGLLFRGWYPGRSWIRFVGTLGSGILVEKLDWRFSTDGRSAADPGPNRGVFVNSDVVVGVFGSLDLGLEVEWSNVLFALMFQHTLQGTKHFDIDGINAFAETPTLVHGPSLRVGYGLW